MNLQLTVGNWTKLLKCNSPVFLEFKSTKHKNFLTLVVPLYSILHNNLYRAFCVNYAWFTDSYRVPHPPTLLSPVSPFPLSLFSKNTRPSSFNSHNSYSHHKKPQITISPLEAQIEASYATPSLQKCSRTPIYPISYYKYSTFTQ